MDVKLKTEIRRQIENALSELKREKQTQGAKSFDFQVSDYAGGFTIKLSEAESSGFSLGAAALGHSTLATDETEAAEDDGDE